jgi:hypothetical protein
MSYGHVLYQGFIYQFWLPGRTGGSAMTDPTILDNSNNLSVVLFFGIDGFSLLPCNAHLTLLML